MKLQMTGECRRHFLQKQIKGFYFYINNVQMKLHIYVECQKKFFLKQIHAMLCIITDPNTKFSSVGVSILCLVPHHNFR